MSKLRDWFKRMAGGEARRIGFGAFAPQPKSPSLGLLAVLPSLSEDVTRGALEAGAEGLVVPAGLAADEEGVRALIKGLTECLWGLQLGDGQAPDSMPGFDFLLVTASSYLSVLEHEDKGRLMLIDPKWDDMQLRAVDQAPLDGAVLPLLRAGEDRPRLEHLLAMKRISMLMRKPLVVELRSSLSEKELSALRDGGLSAVLVPGDTQRWMETIRELRQAIDTLPAKVKAPRELDVILPTVPSGRPSETEEEEEP